jgi:hypothetical protein
MKKLIYGFALFGSMATFSAEIEGVYKLTDSQGVKGMCDDKISLTQSTQGLTYEILETEFEPHIRLKKFYSATENGCNQKVTG